MLELDADTLRKCRAVARRRDSNLQVAAVDHGRIIKVAVIDIVDRVDEDAARVGLAVYGAGDRFRHGGDHESRAVQIGRLEFALTPGDPAIAGERLNCRGGSRRNDRHRCPGRQQSADLGLTDGPSPDKKDWASFELHENGEQGHLLIY
jgi:hypothetical protein